MTTLNALRFSLQQAEHEYDKDRMCADCPEDYMVSLVTYEAIQLAVRKLIEYDSRLESFFNSFPFDEGEAEEIAPRVNTIEELPF